MADKKRKIDDDDYYVDTLLGASTNKVRRFDFDIPRQNITGIIGDHTNTVALGALRNRFNGQLMSLVKRVPVTATCGGGHDEDGAVPTRIVDLINFEEFSVKSCDSRAVAQKYVYSCGPANDVLCLTSGPFVGTGATSPMAAAESMISTARILRAHARANVPEFMCSGIVFVNEPYSGRFSYGLNLMMLTKIHGHKFSISYEKDLFPGAFLEPVVRKNGKNTSFIVYGPKNDYGKLIATGEDSHQMPASIQEVVDFIAQHPEIHVPLSKEDIEQSDVKRLKKAAQHKRPSRRCPEQYRSCT